MLQTFILDLSSTSVMSSLKIAKGFQWTELTLYSLKRG